MTVVGIKTPVKIYEVMQLSENATEQQLELKTKYEQARQLYLERKFDLARNEVKSTSIPYPVILHSAFSSLRN